MKKLLIATAALAMVAGTAQAQSSVTVYGRFDQGYNNVKSTDGAISAAANNTLKGKNTGLDGGVGGSRLGFRGTEDLGGGLKANFVFEFGADVNEDVGVAKTRLGFAELASPTAGTARIGRQVSPVKAQLDAFRALSNNTNFRPGDFYYGATSSVEQGVMNADLRVSNAITYITPTFSGFSAQYQIAEVSLTDVAGKDTTSSGLTGAAVASDVHLNSQATQAKTAGAALNYTAGKFAASYAMFDIKNVLNGANARQDDVQSFAASYDFGVAKLAVIHTLREIKASNVKTGDRDLTSFNVTVPVGKWALTAEYADGSAKTVTGGDSGADLNGYKARAMYNLSNRTGVYAQIGESKIKNKAVADGTDKVQGYNIGIAHTF
jgi:predicted porin